MENTTQNTYSKLTREEKQKIDFLLKREPNSLEKEIIALLWQEKISNKGLEKWFRKLLKTGENILKTDSRNESYIQINQNKIVKFSISSENTLAHKYPYSAASIAVKNVVASTVTKGFKPIAILDSLRIGDFEKSENKKKLIHIIKAISEFSKTVNIPVVGGELFFNYSFNEIPVINTFSLGIQEQEKLQQTKKILPGHEIYLVGAYTNTKNTQHSEGENQFNQFSDIEESSAYSTDSLQEKSLLDLYRKLGEEKVFSKVESVEKGGIINSLNKILKGTKGAKIQLDKIDPSLKGITDFQILASERPARALFIVNKTNKLKFNNCLKASDLSVQKIGEISTENNIQIFNQENLVLNFPSDIFLNKSIPERNILYTKPDRSSIREYSIKDIPMPTNLKEVAWFLLQHKNISSKKHISKHFKFDSPNNNSSSQLSDAAIVAIDEKNSLVVGVDCNSRYVNACPQTGAAIAVAEAAQNIVCSGGTPIGISACINIGNYKNPEIFWQFTEIIKGINKVSREYNIPILNIKPNFENYTTINGEEVNIFPTPTIGMLGSLENKNRLNLNFKSKGDMIFLLGETKNSISSSLYLKSYHKVKNSPPPIFCLKTANKLQKLTTKLADKKLINSAHDVSNGGLIITLIEAALEKDLGFDITTDAENRDDAFLFGEAQNRIIVTVSSKLEIDFIDFMIEQKFPFLTLGHVTKGDLRIDDESWGNISEAKSIFENDVEQNFKKV